MKFKEKYGPWALIAGSAEGLGRGLVNSPCKARDEPAYG